VLFLLDAVNGELLDPEGGTVRVNVKERLSAAKELLDRGFGKPMAPVVDLTGGPFSSPLLSLMTNHALSRYSGR